MAAGIISAIPPPESPWPRRTYEVAAGLPKAVRFAKNHFRSLCEVAEKLAQQVGMPPSISSQFHLLTERWDGKSVLRRAKGDEVPLPLRIAQVTRDAAYQRLIGDDDHVVDVIRSRAGHAFDPRLAKVFVDDAQEILGPIAPESAWQQVLDAEPRPHLMLDGTAIDRALAAMGAFADLASPYLSGHSAGVGQLAEAAAKLCTFDASDVTAVRRAGHLHDMGRTAIDPRIWAKEGALSVDEWEQVRLHPYHTERVLVRSPFLAPLAAIGRDHHERLDGSGYHRGVGAAMLSPLCRLVAAADAYRAKIEPRPYRTSKTPEEAAAALAERARAGTLDPDMVAAVVEAAGHAAPRIERPAGLTEREAEVIGLLARGMQTKQIARILAISVKTADRHIQNAYGKIDVSTRAAATLFAVEHGLVPWGEFPIRKR
jgi:HD-GYP domain-containing protein (c-di-GMP phosphodiesterase class II)